MNWTKEARREFLDTIDEEVDRLNGLVGNLLDMSRLQAGAVEVRREPVGLDEIVPAALRSVGGTADGVDIRVVDCGEGVAVARREEMLLPFQRLGDSGDDDGVGLGLAVAKGFVEAMGGDIEVEETPGGGLTMIVRLEASA